jgi:hypothetical protein
MKPQVINGYAARDPNPEPADQESAASKSKSSGCSPIAAQNRIPLDTSGRRESNPLMQRSPVLCTQQSPFSNRVSL